MSDKVSFSFNFFPYARFGLFEAMSAIEMMDPKMDAGMLCNKAKKVLQFEPAVKVSVGILFVYIDVLCKPACNLPVLNNTAFLLMDTTAQYIFDLVKTSTFFCLVHILNIFEKCFHIGTDVHVL